LWILRMAVEERDYTYVNRCSTELEYHCHGRTRKGFASKYEGVNILNATMTLAGQHL
jgi:hypothetical protein